MKIGCIVMAAGNARRFGSNKLDARVEGKTLMRRALEAVPAACFDRVVVVTQYPQGMDLAREMGFLPVENPRPDLGLSHTIALGMAHMQDMDGVMFQVSAQPLLRRGECEMLFFGENVLGCRRFDESGSVLALVNRGEEAVECFGVTVPGRGYILE